jgi:hypothetical protein
VTDRRGQGGAGPGTVAAPAAFARVQTAWTTVATTIHVVVTVDPATGESVDEAGAEITAADLAERTGWLQ